MDFLSDLNKIVEEHCPKVHHRGSFRKAMEQFLSHPFKERSWPEIFNGRMYSFQDVLRSETVESYIRVLRSFLDMSDGDPKKMKKRDREHVATAKDLLNFLSHHRMDPDNSLLGLSPSMKILENHARRIREAYRNVPADMDPLTPDDLKAESLILRIMKWSECEDDAKIVADIKCFANQVLTNIQLKVGDLVLARIGDRNQAAASSEITSQSRTDGSDDDLDDIIGDDDFDTVRLSMMTADWQYCRIYRILKNCVIVHNSPLEAKTISVKLQDVIPFDAEMKSLLGLVKTMQSLVEDPVDVLYGRIQRRVKKMLGGFLSEAGIDYFLLKKTFANQVSLFEQPQLEATLKELENLIENESQDFFSRIEQNTSHEVQQFISQLDPMKLFCPTREQSFKQLRNLPITAFAKNRLQYLILTAQTNLDILNLTRRNLLNGETKRQVSEWYLNHIENSVDTWLQDLGYEWDAIPRDYIEKPPRGRHLNEVRDNLELLQSVMDVEGNQSARDFIVNLKDEIYERLDPFVSDMVLVLADCMKIPELTNDTFDELLCSRWKSGDIERPDDEQIAGWVDEGIKDVEYILEMKRLESTSFSKQKTELTKVVPITGLILSRFHRIENELNTVLELWAHLDAPANEEEPDSGFAGMHGAHSAHMQALENFRAKKTNSDKSLGKTMAGANQNSDDGGAHPGGPVSQEEQINSAVASWASGVEKADVTSSSSSSGSRLSLMGKKSKILRNNRLSRMVMKDRGVSAPSGLVANPETQASTTTQQGAATGGTRPNSISHTPSSSPALLPVGQQPPRPQRTNSNKDRRSLTGGPPPALPQSLPPKLPPSSNSSVQQATLEGMHRRNTTAVHALPVGKNEDAMSESSPPPALPSTPPPALPSTPPPSLSNFS